MDEERVRSFVWHYGTMQVTSAWQTDTMYAQYQAVLIVHLSGV